MTIQRDQRPFEARPRVARLQGGRDTSIGALQRRHRHRVREILDATSVFRDDEVAVALELFDETFAVRPARAPYDPGGGAETYEFVGSFSREGGVEGFRVSVEKETHENQTHESETLVGYACYGATPGTDRTYDLYWIAVHPAFQGEGDGTRLLDEVERRLRKREARLLVVETSSRDDYAPTRRFYEARGYRRVAVLLDYYGPDDGRVIYTKRLSPPSELFPPDRSGVPAQ